MPEETLKDPIASRKRAMSKKGRQKGHWALASKNKDGKKVTELYDFFAVLFVLHLSCQPKKDTKKSPRGEKTPKGCHEEKDGKRFWHLPSALALSNFITNIRNPTSKVLMGYPHASFKSPICKSCYKLTGLAQICLIHPPPSFSNL